MKKKQKFPESTSSVPLARQFVAESLTAVAPELSETAALLVSELATNAVVHAESEFEVVVVYPSPSGRVGYALKSAIARRACPPLRGLLLTFPTVAVFCSSRPWPTNGACRNHDGERASPFGLS